MIEENEFGETIRFLPAGKLRAIYLRMLETLEPGRIRNFWRTFPYRRCGQPVSESEMYRMLWDPFSSIGEPYYQRILIGLERFLHDNGLHMEEFCNESFHRLERGSYFGSENVMAWVQETLLEMHQTDQPRRIMMTVLTRGASMSYPGSWCKIFSGFRDADYWTSCYGLATDPGFKSVMEYDIWNFGYGLIKNLPNMFSMPSFEEVRCLTDGRSPDQVFWEETHVAADIFFLEKEPIGRVIGFHEFIRPYIPSEIISELGIPDWKVILLERSHICPVRNRKVAHVGTVLNAPIYLIEVKFLLEPRGKSRPPGGNFLSRLIQGLASENDECLEALRPGHDHLISLASDDVILYLDEERQAIYGGGIRVFLGVPAMIIRKILEDNPGRGSRVYEYRWFKFDSGIFPNAKQSNIELRLRRMKEKLEQVDLDIDFNLPGNGRLEVTVRKNIRMEVLSVSTFSE